MSVFQISSSSRLLEEYSVLLNIYCLLYYVYNRLLRSFTSISTVFFLQVETLFRFLEDPGENGLASQVKVALKLFTGLSWHFFLSFSYLHLIKGGNKKFSVCKSEMVLSGLTENVHYKGQACLLSSAFLIMLLRVVGNSTKCAQTC